jgi:hypothetical protein
MPQTLRPPLFNPFAPGFTDDPYPHYAALRAAAPVYQHPLGFWLLTCYDDVSWLLRASLSVEDSNIAASPLLELREQMYGEEAARPRRVSMLDRDPPDHTRLRRLARPAELALHVSAGVAAPPGPDGDRAPTRDLNGPSGWSGRSATRCATARAWSPSLVSYWSPARTDVMRWVLKPSQCIRPT